MKDPAFLFYSSDFLTGTMFMSNEQIGLYIRMLCAQHQHGGRIDTNVLRTQCDLITNGHIVYSKFKHDERGSYNERLEIEMERRREKSRKAAESVANRWNKKDKTNTLQGEYESNTNVLRSENENENENRNESKKVVRTKFVIPEPMEIFEYMIERSHAVGNHWTEGMIRTEAEKFFNYYESNGWRVGKNPMKNWKTSASNWMINAKPIKQNNNEQRIADHIAKHSDNPHYLNLFPNLNKATTTH